MPVPHNTRPLTIPAPGTATPHNWLGWQPPDIELVSTGPLCVKVSQKELDDDGLEELHSLLVGSWCQTEEHDFGLLIEWLKTLDAYTRTDSATQLIRHVAMLYLTPKGVSPKVDFMTLFVEKDNELAMKLYTALGFVESKAKLSTAALLEFTGDRLYLQEAAGPALSAGKSEICMSTSPQAILDACDVQLQKHPQIDPPRKFRSLGPFDAVSSGEGTPSGHTSIQTASSWTAARHTFTTYAAVGSGDTAEQPKLSLGADLYVLYGSASTTGSSTVQQANQQISKMPRGAKSSAVRVNPGLQPLGNQVHSADSISLASTASQSMTTSVVHYGQQMFSTIQSGAGFVLSKVNRPGSQLTSQYDVKQSLSLAFPLNDSLGSTVENPAFLVISCGIRGGGTLDMVVAISYVIRGTDLGYVCGNLLLY